MNNNDDDILAAIDGAGGFSQLDAPAPAPHPALGESPAWPDDDEGIPADDQRPDDADAIAPALIAKAALEPQNDTGNGQRLLTYYGNDLVNVRGVGWHAWQGDRWRGAGGEEIAVKYAQNTAARIVLEADYLSVSLSEQRAIDAAGAARDALTAMEKAGITTDEQRDKRRGLQETIAAGAAAKAALLGRKVSRRKYAVSSGNTGKINGMLAQAAPHRTVVADDLDRDKLAFNVENGTLHFVCDEVPDPDASDYQTKTLKRWRVELRPHDHDELISKIAPVSYDTTATCPVFDGMVKRFLPIDAVRSFLQRYHGYALTGLTDEQCLVFNYGGGSNWKSTFLEYVCRLMGDYATTIDFDSLSGDNQKSGSQASPDIARLPGARLVRASEPERGVQFKEALIKKLTGGEPMLARHNFKDFFEFRPDFKLSLSGNHKPEISGVDHGIWRRVRLVPWVVTISDAEKRPMSEVMAELWPERAGVLNWLIAGALAYLNGGLRAPKEVIEATAAYREEMDPVGSFVGDCVEAVIPNADGSTASSVSAREMYDSFVAWGLANAVRPWKEKSFATAMSQKGFEKIREGAGRRYVHVRLKNVPARTRRDEPPHPADDEVPM